MTSKLSVQLFKQLYSCLVEERQKYSPHLVYHHTFESYMEGRARRKIKFYKLLFIAIHVFQKYLKIILKMVNSKTCLASS